MDERFPEKIAQTRSITVTAGQAPERIDLFLTHAVLRATRNKVQEAIAAGAVLVNGLTTRFNYKVRPGDVIELTLMKPPPIELIPQNIPLDIRYEDDDMLIVNKPAGMVTHPAYGNRDGTLVNAVLYHVGSGLLAVVGEVYEEEEADDKQSDAETQSEGAGEDSGRSVEPAPSLESFASLDSPPTTDDLIGAEIRPGIVHRLDKDTSGLMVVAKNIAAQSFIAKQFADRSASREYWAIAWGVIEEDAGEIEGNIARDPRDRKRFTVSRREGKYALTRYQVIERFEFATLLSLRLATGRTHQIRVHCAHIRHPIFGDAVYGGNQVVYPGVGAKHKQHIANLLKQINRQALHAKTLGLVQPTTRQWVEFDSELPEDMQRLIEALRQG